MENKRNLDDTNLFHQAINNPLSVSESELLSLITKFPYVQSLRFAYERHLYLTDQKVHHISSTLLYAANPNWLYEYLHKAIPVDEDSEKVVSGSYVSDEDINSEQIDEIQVVAEDNVDIEKEELNALIESNVAYDFFRLEKESPSINESIEEPTILEVPIDTVTLNEKGKGEERISIYDDELMPYSFLWWLHKTRLEHAETYQPFVKAPVYRPEVADQDINRFKQNIDAQVLDQQIRENIFHLQPPEAKLSDEYKHTVPFQVEKKNTDHLIEKFIKEDPQIKPPAADKINIENKARKSSEDQYSLVTETLARIYIEQGLYPKAIEVYKKLVLKYPEKNAYFASEILNLEKKLT
ncbi:hypothetical protein LZQ00_14810 [Sphingobacterium sp. SRCM116780]|uniref:tetratricopeptide repeat protein n=1 Tax=Sphingobacterium sp. SRCM116780 TaxID=2907623 RepID=UPI001F483C22|nr:tetratricopeptide repeat protein [Sphingobacterium sp. SRCM116780]UIR55530.1 hypothetical protein LZQ00_14810 [Sphingobacterium sp. SRCM116780]